MFYIDAHLLWGNSREEIFGSVSRLMRFGGYFLNNLELKMTIFM